jgi:hypothetical protein
VTEGIDYGRVLRDLEERRAQINARFDAAIAALRQIVAIHTIDIQPSLLNLPSQADAAHLKPYAAGSMINMAIQHLASRGGGPVPNMELARALNEGGFPHRSKNFPNTLNSVLWRRAKTVGDIRKTERGWELAQR